MLAKFLLKMGARTPSWVVRTIINLWRPYLGAGIKILYIASDYRYVKVCLKRKWYNGNYMGTQYGGSIYSMTDPFFMLMFLNNLGPGYIVWDKGATIEFKRPGKTDLIAEFQISEEILEEVRRKTKSGDKYIFDLPVEVVDTSGQIIAQVKKTIYVRKKKKLAT